MIRFCFAVGSPRKHWRKKGSSAVKMSESTADFEKVYFGSG